MGRARPRRHRPRPVRRDGDAGVGRGREHRPRQRHAVGREPPVDERRDAHAGRARRRRQPHGAVRHLRAPPDGDFFEYPEGAYGVQSWWDYGHWITTRAERIPNANPFQQNAGEAADYLLAPSEEASREVLASQPEHGGREHPLRDGGLADGLAELQVRRARHVLLGQDATRRLQPRPLSADRAGRVPDGDAGEHAALPREPDDSAVRALRQRGRPRTGRRRLGDAERPDRERRADRD